MYMAERLQQHSRPVPPGPPAREGAGRGKAARPSYPSQLTRPPAHPFSWASSRNSPRLGPSHALRPHVWRCGGIVGLLQVRWAGQPPRRAGQRCREPPQVRGQGASDAPGAQSARGMNQRCCCQCGPGASPSMPQHFQAGPGRCARADPAGPALRFQSVLCRGVAGAPWSARAYSIPFKFAMCRRRAVRGHKCAAIGHRGVLHLCCGVCPQDPLALRLPASTSLMLRIAPYGGRSA
jgi:hypothetical protein